MPQVQWHAYEPVDFEGASRGYSAALGQSLRPVYHFDKAKVIFSLDCDFLGTEQDAFSHIRGYAKGRQSPRWGGRSRKHQPPLCGGEPAQPHRVQCRPPFSSDVQSGVWVAAAMMDQCFEELGGTDNDAGSPIPALRTSLRDKAKQVPQIPDKDGWSAKWISESVKDLVAHKGNA